MFMLLPDIYKWLVPRYGDLTQQVAELELLCDGEADPEALDRLFRSIPRHEQLLSQSKSSE